VLDGMCSIGRRDERVKGWIDELESLASRTGMRELLLRAYVHRARRGDARAWDAARLLGPEWQPERWAAKHVSARRCFVRHTFITRSLSSGRSQSRLTGGSYVAL